MTIPEHQATNQRNSYSAPARLSSLPVVTRSQKLWCAVLGALFAFDLVDINSFSYAAPAISQEWGLSLKDVSAVTSVTFLGMFAGGLVGGRVSDRFGRKRTIIGAVLAYSLFSLLTTLATTLPVLLALRFFTGFGVQAMTGVLIVYVAEMFPRRSRGRYQAVLLGVGLIGVPMAAWFARLTIPAGPGMWRWVFVLGAAGAVVGIVGIRILPESVRWQSMHGDHLGATATVARLEAEATSKVGGRLPTPVEEPAVRPGRAAELLRGRNRRNAIVMSVSTILIVIAFYGYNAYVPTLLVHQGYSTSQALSFTSYFSIAAVPGALLAWPVVDRWERKVLLPVMTVIVGALVVAFGAAGQPAIVLVTGFLVTMFLQTQTVFLYAYLPEMFPTPLRGLGTGLANGLGRIGVFVAGFGTAGLVAVLGFGGYFAVIAGVLVLGGATIALFGMRTTNRPLLEDQAATGEQHKDQA
ncbi:MFS transporter [Amycolatopsis deserti]|uniref:MFS transporter n=1 Tax=Amycolatopsis deserti TaxID=185696 RepID=UPI001749AA8B|nr:MFS transporter [Amycolatopsis deserti]